MSVDTNCISQQKSKLTLAAQHHLRTVAFPCISTGVYHFPIDRACAIAVREISAFPAAQTEPMGITVVCFNAQSYEAYARELSASAG